MYCTLCTILKYRTVVSDIVYTYIQYCSQRYTVRVYMHSTYIHTFINTYTQTRQARPHPTHLPSAVFPSLNARLQHTTSTVLYCMYIVPCRIVLYIHTYILYGEEITGRLFRTSPRPTAFAFALLCFALLFFSLFDFLFFFLYPTTPPPPTCGQALTPPSRRTSLCVASSRAPNCICRPGERGTFVHGTCLLG